MKNLYPLPSSPPVRFSYITALGTKFPTHWPWAENHTETIAVSPPSYPVSRCPKKGQKVRSGTQNPLLHQREERGWHSVALQTGREKTSQARVSLAQECGLGPEPAWSPSLSLLWPHFVFTDMVGCGTLLGLTGAGRRACLCLAGMQKWYLMGGHSQGEHLYLFPWR